MYRNELNYTDDQLTDILFNSYGIRAQKLDFINIGSFFAFIVNTDPQNKLFLKVYPKNQSLVPIPPTIESLNNIGIALHRFRKEFGIHNISYCMTDHAGQYCHAADDLFLILFEHIEGFHPSYSPNQLTADKLAKTFFQLHQIPINSFPYFEQENFDIHYALGLSDWIDHQITLTNNTHSAEMFALLSKHKEQLKAGIKKLQQWQMQFSKEPLTMVITHGDAHHFNVLQTPLDIWLVDWDGLKIAPIERDLWHYEYAPLIDEYCKLNPNYNINHELCAYYQLQRFFEDLRYYLEQVLLGKNTTSQQSEQDLHSFLTHWGWSMC